MDYECHFYNMHTGSMNTYDEADVNGYSMNTKVKYTV